MFFFQFTGFSLIVLLIFKLIVAHQMDFVNTIYFFQLFLQIIYLIFMDYHYIFRLIKRFLYYFLSIIHFMTYNLSNNVQVYFVTVRSVRSNALCEAQKDEPSCDKHKKQRLLRKLNSRVFCELCSQKTPRGTLPVNSDFIFQTFSGSVRQFLL